MKKKFSVLIRDARVREGLSQQKLAESIGLQSDAQISRIERGSEFVAFKHVKSISEILKIPYEELKQAWLDALDERAMPAGRA